MGRFDGRVAFVTGAARGMGRAHAVALAREGASVVVSDTTRPIHSVPYPLPGPDDLDETARLAREAGGRCLAVEADVRDMTAMHQAVESGIEEFGRLDHVVANAGIMSPAPTLDMGEAAWQEMIDINLTGQWRTLAAAVPHLVTSGRGGSVVVISSLAAMHAQPGTAHYSAAKAGLVAMMKVMAAEWAGDRIRINTVHPTTTATPMALNDVTYRTFRPDLESPTRLDFEQAARRLNRLDVALIEPEEVTSAVLFLLSDEARSVTGTTMLIDAGAAL
jgi:SDR family mycofactocin-dependent oxidoreductase